MSPGLTFERVYHSLKEQLGSGRFGAGEHLEPAVLSEELCASITPVRDALHRLVGEGLVEAPRGDGFRTPIVTEVGLRHLYRWNAAVLNLATRVRDGPPPGVERVPDGSTEILVRIERLFAAIGYCSGNPENIGAIMRLNDRLRPVRRAELRLLPDVEEELHELGAKLEEGKLSSLRRPIADFHRRRERLVGEIVAELVQT